MKLTNYIISLGICLLGGMAFISCSSSDDDEQSDSLSGKWEIRLSDKDSQGTLSFTFRNGTVTYIEKWSEPGYDDDIETYSGPYTIEEDIVTMTLRRVDTKDQDRVFVFKWEINGKTLTLTPIDSNTKEYWGISPIVYNKK